MQRRDGVEQVTRSFPRRISVHGRTRRRVFQPPPNSRTSLPRTSCLSVISSIADLHDDFRQAELHLLYVGSSNYPWDYPRLGRSRRACALLGRCMRSCSDQRRYVLASHFPFPLQFGIHYGLCHSIPSRFVPHVLHLRSHPFSRLSPSITSLITGNSDI